MARERSWWERVRLAVRRVWRGRREAGREGWVAEGAWIRAERRVGLERRWVRSTFLGRELG